MTDPVQPPDPDRRRFFRQFAGEVVTSVGSVVGAAQSLQQTSAEAARELLGSDPLAAPVVDEGGGAAGVGRAGRLADADASTAGWRAPFRWDGDVCYVVDQRRLPDVLADLDIRSAADAVTAINDGAIIGSAVQAQVAAVTLALVSIRAATSRPFARRAMVRGAANALRNTRPGSAAMAAALDRMLVLLDVSGLEAPGEAQAAALVAEAERIIAEVSDDHGALVSHLLATFPGEPDVPLRILVAGSTGAMGGGMYGTALSAVQAAHHAGRSVHVLVPEGRPAFDGSRIAAWELRQAGVPCAILTDAAGPGRIAAGEVSMVLVGADRIAANGDLIAPAGAYPLALAARAASVPFLACAATTAIDPALATGAGAVIEDGRPTLVLRAAGSRVAPQGMQVRNPLQDLVPADLVTGIATETGILRAPFGPAIAAAVTTAAERRASSAGFAALQARRAASDQPPGNQSPGNQPVDVAAMRDPARASVL